MQVALVESEPHNRGAWQLSCLALAMVNQAKMPSSKASEAGGRQLARRPFPRPQAEEARGWWQSRVSGLWMQQ